jgi:hypothetical protein
MSDKPDMFRKEGCNLLYDNRYAVATNSVKRYEVTKIICKECEEICMFAGVD